MNPSEGLQTALNQIRETLVADNKVYQEQIPLVEHILLHKYMVKVY